MSIWARLRLRGQEALTYLRLADPARAGVRFVIFAQGRTGTWLLYDLLNAHPQITCDKEILQPRRLAPDAFVEAASHRRSPVYGFHVQIRQLLESQRLEPGAFLARLHGRGWRIIYLRRRNFLRQSVSTLIANQRQLWHTTDPAQRPGRTVVDLDALMAWLDRRQDYQNRERAALQGLPHLPLVYEDDLLDAQQHQPALDRVFDFLGVDAIPVAARLQRLGSDRLADAVENYAELVARVAASPYREFLE